MTILISTPTPTGKNYFLFSSPYCSSWTLVFSGSYIVENHTRFCHQDFAKASCNSVWGSYQCSVALWGPGNIILFFSHTHWIVWKNPQFCRVSAAMFPYINGSDHRSPQTSRYLSPRVSRKKSPSSPSILLIQVFLRQKNWTWKPHIQLLQDLRFSRSFPIIWKDQLTRSTTSLSRKSSLSTCSSRSYSVICLSLLFYLMSRLACFSSQILHLLLNMSLTRKRL